MSPPQRKSTEFPHLRKKLRNNFEYLEKTWKKTWKETGKRLGDIGRKTWENTRKGLKEKKLEESRKIKGMSENAFDPR